jgi:hypothetical protein
MFQWHSVQRPGLGEGVEFKFVCLAINIIKNVNFILNEKQACGNFLFIPQAV